jgi:hypothetical protein
MPTGSAPAIVTAIRDLHVTPGLDGNGTRGHGGHHEPRPNGHAEPGHGGHAEPGHGGHAVAGHGGHPNLGWGRRVAIPGRGAPAIRRGHTAFGEHFGNWP